MHFYKLPTIDDEEPINIGENRLKKFTPDVILEDSTDIDSILKAALRLLSEKQVIPEYVI